MIIKLLSNSDKGGILVADQTQINFFNDKDRELFVLGFNYPGSREQSNLKIPGYKVSFSEVFVKNNILARYRIFRWMFYDVVPFWVCYRKVCRLNKDIFCLIFSSPRHLLISILLGKLLKTRIIWTIPGPDIVKTRLRKKIYGFMINKFNIMPVANSKTTAEILGFSKKIFVYPGYDPSRIKTDLPSTIRRDFRIPQDAMVFSSIARLEPIKAPDIIIDAFQQSFNIEKNCFLLMVGSSNSKKYLESLKQLVEPKYRERIKFLGHRGDISNILSSTNVFVHAIRIKEGFGISLAEALASGVPCIAADRGAPGEYIKTGYNGWLVKEMNTNSYIKTYQRAYKDFCTNRQHFITNSLNSAEELGAETQLEKLLVLINGLN